MGVRRVARGPHEETRVELLPVRQHDTAVFDGDELGVQVHVRSALSQRPHHPRARSVADLGQDPAPRLDQMEPQLVLGEFGVVLEQRGRQVQQFTEPLDAGESTAHEGDGEEPAAFGAARQRRRAVERGEQPVADGDGLLDMFQAERLVAEPGYREGAGHRPGRDHEDVVAELVVRTTLRPDSDGVAKRPAAGHDTVPGCEDGHVGAAKANTGRHCWIHRSSQRRNLAVLAAGPRRRHPLSEELGAGRCVRRWRHGYGRS